MVFIHHSERDISTYYFTVLNLVAEAIPSTIQSMITELMTSDSDFYANAYELLLHVGIGRILVHDSSSQNSAKNRTCQFTGV
jgi:hypothetical protein